MDEKSQKLLEFPRIKEIIAGYTDFSGSAELAVEIRPLADRRQIELLLKQSKEARHLLALEANFAIGKVRDVRALVKKAALRSALEATQLVEIQQTLSSLRRLRGEFFKLRHEFPLLWQVAAELVELPQLEKQIAKCLDPAGEVLDGASPVLADLRRQIRDTRAELLSRLEKMVTLPRLKKILQDEIITERYGRHVIPVKVESRHRLKGIIHDLSNTGATAFIEPQVTVGLGNALRELEIAEKHEVQRILDSLSGEVGVNQEEIVTSLNRAAELDLALAKARFAREFQAVEPELTDDGENGEGQTLRMVAARHPLLGKKAVPLTVEIGNGFTILIITGPNTGGKTVALKTIGLLGLMTQAGIPIPAAPESLLPIFDDIFSDIGDEQSIEQTLSTFSWHVGNIVRIVNRATERSLVLFDELGTSTDPAEGSALARALLLRFLNRGTLAVATTHQNELKAFAHVTDGLENASFEFDPETLQPTYHLRVGVPGGSNALATAARLGLPMDIIDSARGMLEGSGQQLESLLAHLAQERQQAADIRRNLEKTERAAIQKDAALHHELEQLRAEKNRVIQDTRDEVTKKAAELHRRIQKVAAELRKTRSAQRIGEARQELAAVREGLKDDAFTPEVAEETASPGAPLAPGDTVWLRELNLEAKVLQISESSQEALVQAGQSRFRLGLANLEKLSPPTGAKPKPATPIGLPSKFGVSLELNLRGKRAHEIEPELDSYLNDASLAGLSEVRIIHGMGTGTVRDIVRDFITTHPLVKSFRGARKDEGGEGATVVSL